MNKIKGAIYSFELREQKERDQRIVEKAKHDLEGQLFWEVIISRRPFTIKEIPDDKFSLEKYSNLPSKRFIYKNGIKVYLNDDRLSISLKMNNKEYTGIMFESHIVFTRISSTGHKYKMKKQIFSDSKGSFITYRDKKIYLQP